jgi:hypothetical protein
MYSGREVWAADELTGLIRVEVMVEMAQVHLRSTRKDARYSLDMAQHCVF